MPNIKIVLVETSHPGNIGAAARAMKNMCLSELVLVNPKAFPSSVATARASGADDVLAGAICCTSLQEAVKDCSLIIGASARLRSVKWPELAPRQCAALVSVAAEASSVAIIFGREDAGLSNAELDICQYLVHIPTNPAYQSLNIAAAIQVIAYELYLAKNQEPGSGGELPPRATAEKMEGFFTHMEQALTEIGFLRPPSCQKLMRRLRRVFNRAQLDETDVNILRGVLSAAQGKKYDWDVRGKRK
ncbi:MAG TPA: RNA methyltransferase [Gammaproteobacteria bacterium]|nr:RNA methyltransferase [Gammaproteobacteria bacterium]